MCVFAILCFAAIATALPLDKTAFNNITDILSTEKLPIESTNLPQSHDNLNQGKFVASNVENSGELKNNSKDYHDGRGDTPLLDLGSYEEQHNKEKDISLNSNHEPIIKNEKMENNMTNEFAEPKSTDNVPITETNTVLGESTTLSVSTEKEEQTSLVTSNSLQEIRGLENQKTISTPLPLIDIQHKHLKENIFSPAPNSGPQNKQVSETQEITSSPVPKSDSQQKEQEFKSEASKVSEAPKTPSSIPESVSQPKEQLQDITTKSFPKSQIQSKGEISVSKPKTTSHLPDTKTQQSGQSLKKQIMPFTNLLASGNSKRQEVIEGEHKIHSSLPEIKIQQKEQVLKGKDKTSPLLSAFNNKKGHVIPLPDSHVLQKERGPNAEKSYLANKLKGHNMKQEPKAVAPVHILENQKQKVPEREEITSYPISDIEKEEDELGEIYNCAEERYPWFNVAVPPLFYGNGLQAPVPVDLSPPPIFLPYPNPFFYKRPLIRYPNFVIV
ncbi:uncharacterized protein LOC125055852 [Pieris napi]|uniref:uncharacterized protein LOC125055852 n=1 Tax=Pieris napi TaxID=78633 RepID=UPI001FB931D1|nr:uncharacterized protein LOC125055852 [Pieris napi]